MTKTSAYRKKLIEVALPLEAINKAAAREKSIRHGHPSTLHLWWARRPLAAARAVIFAQMVDDPSAHPDLFPTEKKQEKERKRLFKIIEELVRWENTNNEEVLQAARDEIWQSWRHACAANADHPRAKELFDRHTLPAFHDPFAGGGALPLEAQRLGLESYASDLNPVAVLIAYSDETHHLFHENACHSFHVKLGHRSRSKPSQRIHLKVGHGFRSLSPGINGDFADTPRSQSRARRSRPEEKAVGLNVGAGAPSVARPVGVGFCKLGPSCVIAHPTRIS